MRPQDFGALNSAGSGAALKRPNPYRTGLDRNQANHAALSPLSFLARAAEVYPQRVAVIHGERRLTWAQTYQRCRRLASALARRGVGIGDTVAVMAPNVPAMFEAHYGVPMTGAVLNTLNTRLDAETIAFMLDSRRGQGADHRSRVFRHDRKGAAPDRAASRSSSISTIPARAANCWARPSTRISSAGAIRNSTGGFRTMSGTPSRCRTPRARPEIPKAS